MAALSDLVMPRGVAEGGDGGARGRCVRGPRRRRRAPLPRVWRHRRLPEGEPPRLLCHRSQGKAAAAAGEEEDDGVSDILYVRRSACRDALLRLVAAVDGGTRRKEGASPAKARSPRWSDCGCGKCRAWRTSGVGGDRLRFVL
ncbi:monoacylglycerol lipase abhd6-B [Hordeum vulgare]|nr:monoacylglycerol lipase abhd6-B [Hordeum vulgare]